MIFSWVQVTSFFGVLALVGWLIYPSEYFRGQMYRDEGSRARSIEFYRDYLARHPFHKGATRSLAAAYEAAGRPEEGVALLEGFYRHRRGDAEAGRDLLEYMDRALLSERAAAFRSELSADLRGRPAADRRWLEELAYQDLQEATVAQDDARVAQALKTLAAVAAEGSGYRDQALRMCLLRKDFPAALAMIQENAAAEPSNPEWPRMRVRVLRLMNDTRGTLAALADGVRRFPRDVGLLAERVDLLSKAKRCREALPDLRTLMALQPSEPSWPREVGTCLLDGGDLRGGIRFLEDLLKKDPSDRQMWWSLIYAFADRGFYAESSAWLERYAARFPDDENGLDMLIYEYEVMEMPDKAIGALTRHLARSPGDLKHALARASLLATEDRYPESARAYEELVKRNPGEKDFWKALIYQYESHHDYARTKEAARRYLRRFPGEAKAYDTLTSVQLELGEKKEAIETLEDYFRRQGMLLPSRGQTPAPPGGGR